MTDRFQQFIPYLWQVEGTTYENDPADPGGATKYGLDQRSHPRLNIRSLTEEQAKEVYWEEWQDLGVERLPYPLGEVYFDICVNNGKSRADQLFSLGRDAKTILSARDAFYRRLAERRPASKKYLKGWLNRGDILRRHLGLA